MAEAEVNRSPLLLSVSDLTVPLPHGSDRPFAVRKLNLQLRAGEILCVVGESGSGKSICANAVMGLLPAHLKPSGGVIRFKGKDLLTMSEERLLSMRGREIGMVFQEPMSALNPTMRVGAQISEVLAVHDAYPGPARNRRVLQLLDLVGLPNPQALQHAYPFQMSGGQRQRVMIAMALALEPAVLIADEPTTALDVTTQAQILALIKQLQGNMGMGVLFITHDFGVVADIADRVAVMEKGLLVEEGPANQVLNHPVHPYTKRLLAAVPDHTKRKPSRADFFEPGLLEVHNLRKTYRSSRGLFAPKRTVAAVNDVSFQVQHGETLGIVGESGSGKSTIGKCLLRLTDFEGGRIVFDGNEIAGLSPREFRPQRKNLQMIFQDPFASLNPRQTVGRTLTQGPVANGVAYAAAQQRAMELLERVELDPSAFNRYPNEFSGGQRQRIGIARALAMNPRMLVADESVSALDVSVQAQVLELLNQIQEELGLAMIFITHDLRVAAQICHKVLVLHNGAVVEDGAPSQVFDRPQHPYTQKLVRAIPGQQWRPLAAPTTVA